jgi:hypothetical protein
MGSVLINALLVINARIVGYPEGIQIVRSGSVPRSRLMGSDHYYSWMTGKPEVDFPIADNPGVVIATTGLSQVDYSAENGAGKRWV